MSASADNYVHEVTIYEGAIETETGAAIWIGAFGVITR
jgi:hypothetical protein